MLPVSLVDSVTAKVDDEKKTLHTIYACGIHHVVYFLMYFVCAFYMVLYVFLYKFYIHLINV